MGAQQTGDGACARAWLASGWQHTASLWSTVEGMWGSTKIKGDRAPGGLSPDPTQKWERLQDANSELAEPVVTATRRLSLGVLRTKAGAPSLSGSRARLGRRWVAVNPGRLLLGAPGPRPPVGCSNLVTCSRGAAALGRATNWVGNEESGAKPLVL